MKDAEDMTYCVAITTQKGLVFCSDSRTNAGADMLSTYSKMHVFCPASDRMFILLTAGNLATTQAIISRIESELEEPDSKVNLLSCRKMVDAAKYINDINRDEQTKAQATTAASKIDTSATLLFGGQIKDGEPAIFLMYSAGNFIAAAHETSFLQIGESKYGKPILDRIITRNTSLEDAARCALVSMDSTIKSNATVGPPIEIMVYETDSYESNHYLRLDEDDDYLRSIRQSWNEAIQTAFAELPLLEWEKRTMQPAATNIHPIIHDSHNN